MVTAGTLNLVLGADSTKLRQELSKVRQESQGTALAITNLFTGDSINAAGFRILRGTITGVIRDIDEMNEGLSLGESFTRNLAGSFNELGDIALLQLGQIAQFLGDDLFENPLLAGFQGQALQNAGLGQLEGAFQIVTAGVNAAKLAQPALLGVQEGFSAIDSVLGGFQAKAAAVSEFFGGISRNAKLAGDVLKGFADIVDGSIDSIIDSLAATNPAIATAKEALAALGIEFKVGRSFLGEYIDNLQKLEDTADAVSRSSGQIADGTNQVRGGLKGASSSVENFQDTLERQRKAGEQVAAGMKDLADAATLLDVYNQANTIFENLFGTLEETFNAAKGAENLQNRLQTTSRSAGGAAEDLQFLSEITDELGLNFDATADGYAKFSAAASQSNLSVEQTNEIFENVAQSASVMRLSVGDTQGVFLALQQSLSGGNVQLEELNQLAERVPGAFQAAEVALRQLGYEAGSVRDIISTGDVDSESFIPAFAAQLANTTQSGVVGASQSAEAAVNRFNNSLGNLQIAMGKTWLEVGTPALNVFADALQFATENEELFSTAIDTFLVAAVFRGTVAVVSFTKAVFTSGQTISLFGKQITLTASGIGKLAAQAALAYAVVILFYRNLERAQDAAEGTRTAIASLDKSLVDLSEAADNVPELERLIPEDPIPADWLDAGVAGFNRFNEAINRTLGVPEGFLNITTSAEKQANDTLAALGDFSQKAQAILGESLNLRIETEQGTGAIRDLQEIDGLLKQIEERKLEIDPGNTEAIAAIKAEEEDLLKRRSQAQKEVLATQSAVNNALAQARTELQNLDPSKLGREAYDQAKAQLETQITLIEREKAALDELANTAISTAQTIAESFEKSNQDLEKAFIEGQASIAEALASGNIDEDQARQQNLENERQYFEQRLTLTREKLAELQAELERDSTLRAVDPTAAGLLSPEQVQQYQQQVQQLELESAQQRISLAQNVAAGKRDALDQELSDLSDANDAAIAAAERSENDRIAAIRQAQLSGQIDETEATRQIEEVRKAAIAKEIELEQAKLAQIRELAASGVLTREEAAAKEAEILGNLSALNLQRIEQELAAREAANRKIIEDFERANRRAEQTIERSQSERVAAVRESQLAGVTSAQEAEDQIREIQRNSTQETINLRRQELEEVRRLQQQGVLDAEEAADREAELINEIGSLNLERIEAEIEAQQRLAQERIAAQFQPQLRGLDNRSAGLQSELDLLSAQSGLQESLNNLAVERLNTRIATAQAAGNETQVAALQAQLQQLQVQQSEAQYQIKLQELEIQQEIRSVELQRELINARMALAEAEANGASEQELANRRQLVALAERAIANQERLNGLQRQQIETEQAITREQQRRSQIEQEAQSASSSSATSSPGSSSGGSTGDPASVMSRLLDSKTIASTQQGNEAFKRALTGAGDQRLNLLNEAIAGAINSNDFLIKLDAAKLGGIGDIAARVRSGQLDQSALQSAAAQAQLRGQDPWAAIQQLAASVNRLASSPRSLSISSPDPIGDTGRVLANISSQSLAGVGL